MKKSDFGIAIFNIESRHKKQGFTQKNVFIIIGKYLIQSLNI